MSKAVVSTAVKPFYVSPSQLTTKRTCRRKWYLEKIIKQPQEDKDYFDYGTVLHGVAERFLKADDRGIDPTTGHPVELYPPGWEAMTDSGIAIPVQQQDLIRRLIDEAIKRGILRRSPGRQIEVEAEHVLSPPQPARGGVPAIPRIVFKGKIDVLLPDGDAAGVEDHKSLGNWKYAETSKSLAKNPQLLLYCWALGELRKEQGLPPLKKYLVRHNQFGKDPAKPKVGHVEAWVSADDVLLEVSLAQRDAEEMHRWSSVKKWQDVPGAQKEGGCRAYGGCPYVRICGGELDLQQHADLTNRINQDRLRARLESSERQAVHAKEVAVGSNTLKDMMAARAAKNGGGTKPPQRAAPAMNSGVGTAPAAPPINPPKPPAGPKPVAAPPSDAAPAAAPWASADCPACTKGKATILGVTVKGGVCVVCDTRTGRLGKPTSKDYIITPGEQPGTVTWTPRPGGKAAGQAATTAAVTSEPVEEVADEATSHEDHDAEEAARDHDGGDTGEPESGELSHEEAAAVASAPTPTKRPVGRPPKAQPTTQTASPHSAAPRPVGPPTARVERKVPAAQPTGRPVGRPKKGFTLFFGSMRTRGASVAEPPIFLSQVLSAMCDAIAEASGRDFWAVDTWERRDAIKAKAELVAEDWGTRDVIADCMETVEGRELSDMLRNLAGSIVEVRGVR